MVCYNLFLIIYVQINAMIYPNPALPKRKIISGIILSLSLMMLALLIPGLAYLYIKHSYTNLEIIFFISRLLLWLCLAVMYFYSTRIEKQSFLLYDEKKYAAGFYILSIVCLIIILFIQAFLLAIILKLTGLYSDKNEKFIQLLHVFNGNKSLMIFTVLTAGIMEELMFRGYLLSRLEVIFKNKSLAIIISSVLFGLIHFGYGTLQNIIVPIFIGALFALYYSRYKNILVLIIAHFLYDLILMLLSLHHYFPK